MKFTYNWLKDYIETDLTPEQIAEKLTGVGLEVDDMYHVQTPVVARVLECEKIPDTHLHLLKVDDGETTRQIVCGAHNCRVGLVSALARPGTVIEGREIGIGKMKGYESEGMMCSVRELGVGTDHDGIIELDAGLTPGEQWNGRAPDTVFDIAILPNMAHCLGVWNIAWDLAATDAGQFNWEGEKRQKDQRLEINIDGETDLPPACSVFRTLRMDGVQIRPGDKNIADRLQAIGINPRNNIVDVTNYICYDLNQPMHAYDADKINGKITVRMAKDGEEFTDLFGKTHSLLSSDLVVADDAGVLGLAGIIGGGRSGITDDTRNIILESAYFDPATIRKTKTRLGISTDASFRFERGIERYGQDTALMAAKMLIENGLDYKTDKMGLIYNVYDKDYARAFDNPQIAYDTGMFKKITGFELSAKAQINILKKLGYGVENSSDSLSHITYNISQPSWRVDDAIPEKLVADVLRICGYDKFDSSVPIAGQSALVYRDANTKIIEHLVARGLTQRISFGFSDSNKEKLVSARPNIMVKNPIAEYLDTARNSLVPNMLDAIALNTHNAYADLAMFELGTVFDGPNPGQQHTEIVIARTGEYGPRHWLKRGRPVDVFDVKADIESILNSKFLIFNSGAPAPWAHPYRYGRYELDGQVVAEFGELHPKLAKTWKIKVPVMLGVINDPKGRHPCEGRDPLQLNGSGATHFPPIKRDFSFLLEKEISAGVILAAARGADAQIVDAREFDFYAPCSKIESDQKDCVRRHAGENSIAFEITIVPTRNLSDADLTEIQNLVIAAVEPLGAKIRDK